VKADAFPKVKNPLSPLKLPGLGQHADIFVAPVVHLDQGLYDVPPNTGDAAAAIAVGMQRIQANSLIDDNAIVGRSPTHARD
jgi:hypothetical protein